MIESKYLNKDRKKAVRNTPIVYLFLCVFRIIALLLIKNKLHSFYYYFDEYFAYFLLLLFASIVQLIISITCMANVASYDKAMKTDKGSVAYKLMLIVMLVDVMSSGLFAFMIIFIPRVNSFLLLATVIEIILVLGYYYVERKPKNE